MSFTKAPRASAIPAPVERLLSRNSLIVAAALAAAAALAWAWLFHQAGMAGMAGMEGMDGMAAPAQPWSAAYLGPTIVMWAIMMVAMMIPSAAPMILLHARIDRAETRRQRLLNSLLFGLAYLLVWSLFSIAAAFAQALLVATGAVSAAGLSIGSRAAAAGLLAIAAVYELTLAKQLCLEKCQSPLTFVMRYWRPGAAGALRLGLAHGLFCVGCCWALMALLFVGGVMNLAWVALLGIVVLGEKMAPPKWHVNRIVAAAMAVAAALLLLA